MTQPDYQFEGLSSTFPAGSTTIEVPLALPESTTQMHYYREFGFQAGNHSATVTARRRRPGVPAEFLERMRKASERRKSRVATPDAGTRMAEEFEVWAPLRRAATSALLGDDE